MDPEGHRCRMGLWPALSATLESSKRLHNCTSILLTSTMVNLHSKMRKKKKYQSYPFATVPIHLAPSYMQFNPYITEGYRTKLTTYQCFQSMFTWSNETMNVWTHSMGFALFIGLFFYDFVVVYWEHKTSIYDVLMASFVLTCFMICMIFSSLYHLLNCHSFYYCKIWLTWDIFGISVAFFAIFVSGIYYGFWCEEHLHLRFLYLGFVCLLFTAAMAFLLMPRFTGDEWSWVRLTVFSLWSLSGLLPTLHWAHINGGMETDIVKVFLPRIFNMYAISGVALLTYVFKFPESLLPGRFNYIGASHQLWHIIVVVALFYWHQSGLKYAQYREINGCST